MLLDPRLLKVGVCAAKESGRYAINGIHFGEEGVAAMDGRILAFCTYGESPDAADYPKVEGGPDPTASVPVGTILPLDALKALPKVPKRSDKPVLEYLAVERVNGTLRVGATDLKTAPTVDVRPIDGEFPSFAKLIPSEETRSKWATFHVNAHYLATLLKAAVASCTPEGSPFVAIRVNPDPSGPSVVEAKWSARSRHFVGLIMPVREDK